MGRGVPPRGLQCPGCGTGLEALGEAAPDAHRLVCPRCGETFRARRRSATAGGSAGGHDEPEREVPPAGAWALFWRGAALLGIEWAYRIGVFGGTLTLFALGGFVPVVRAWLRDEVDGWGGVVEVLGGAHVVTETRDPDADLGPVLARGDAPLIFTAVDEVSRRLGVRPPGQVRLTYLPCCGMVAWGGSQALILGLPLLRVLTLAELRAVIAHELAHLARGDATRAAKSARFVEALGQAVERVGDRARGPLGHWARLCGRCSSRLIGPIARGQETRADRSAAAIAGGSAAASALVKVALVQPLFREVLKHYDPATSEDNLYAFFRAFWFRLPAEVHTAMRLRVLTNGDAANDPAHPPLPDRLALLQSYPDPAGIGNDSIPATTLIGDLEFMEQMLHNRLFALPTIEPTVFHRARA